MKDNCISEMPLYVCSFISIWIWINEHKLTWRNYWETKRDFRATRMAECYKNECNTVKKRKWCGGFYRREERMCWSLRTYTHFSFNKITNKPMKKVLMRCWATPGSHHWNEMVYNNVSVRQLVLAMTLWKCVELSQSTDNCGYSPQKHWRIISKAAQHEGNTTAPRRLELCWLFVTLVNIRPQFITNLCRKPANDIICLSLLKHPLLSPCTPDKPTSLSK